MPRTLQDIADVLWDAQHGPVFTPVPPVRDDIAALGGDVLDNAYRVQQINTLRRTQSGARIVGRKIGLTSKTVQAQLGVDRPDFGTLFADTSYCDGQDIPIHVTQQAKVEAEIAFVLDRDLTHEQHTVADVLGAIGYALPAIEVVGSRIANWDIRLADTVADNASSGLFVLGTRPVRLRDFDLVNCGMVMERRGDQVSVGVGAACLGNPLHAAIWLANTMVRVGSPLHAGDVVLTGALGPMVAIQPGDVFTAHIEGLGSVRALFSNETESKS